MGKSDLKFKQLAHLCKFLKRAKVNASGLIFNWPNCLVASPSRLFTLEPFLGKKN